ncbi:ATP-binding protein [Simiduia sp. 21SJ11W-1]|uniref:response regulator n=1 Tax=Simiduia sp. 21SJ11W-1 TaxID=2909669 RepID=UPI0020A12F75|nr:response regulator [Simiduia sp. 21SJ11W-1]UTA46520.1 ATP-binding protein [Simiduia sp. 21SJ11W-1]
MTEQLVQFFSSEYMPHGHCYLWLPSILWMNVVADLLIALSYFSIPVILISIIRQRKDVKFKGIFLLFAAFILLCGATHLFAIYTIWHGAYGWHGIMKLVTAVVSVFTAAALFANREAILSIPSTYKLELALQDAEDANNAKRNFLACMSHEVRTPINGVVGMLDLALRNESDPEQSKRLETAKKSANALLSVINDIIDISKVEAGKLDVEHVAFNLHELLGDTARSFAFNRGRKDIELVLDATAVTHETVLGDPGRIRQVVSNLMGNAVKFTSQGTVKLVAELVEVEGELGTLSCKVIDTGIGIEKSQLGNIFSPFTQEDSSTTRKYGGTGLGLAICQQLCRLMGGDVWVKSEKGKGSEFGFRVPVGIVAASRSKVLAANHADENVLLVDANKETQNIVYNYLRQAKYNVIRCANEDDIARLDGSVAANIDVLLVDGKTASCMPAKVLEEFVYDHPCVKRVWILDYDNENRYDAPNLPLTGYINKPVAPLDLLACLDRGESLTTSKPAAPAVSGMLPLRVLVVEDNDINRSVVEGILETKVSHLVFAENGEVAIEVMKSVRVDLVLMDCQMPVMDGYEATRAIRAGRAGDSYITIPIIAMTANAMEGDRERCLEAGMDEYLSKPVDMRKMHALIELYAQKLGRLAEAGDGASTADEPSEALKFPEGLRYIMVEKMPVSARKNPSRMMSMFRSFILNNRNFVELLERAINDEDHDTQRAIMHNMKGISANLGMNPLYERVKKINVGLRMGREVDQPHFDALSDVFDATLAELERIVEINSHIP